MEYIFRIKKTSETTENIYTQKSSGYYLSFTRNKNNNKMNYEREIENKPCKIEITKKFDLAFEEQ